MKYSVNYVKYDFLLWHSRGRKGGGPKTLAVESWVRLPSARKTRWRPKCFESVLFSVAILSNSLCRSQQISLIIATLRYADEFLLRICLEIVYCLQFTGCSKHITMFKAEDDCRFDYFLQGWGIFQVPWVTFS